MKITSSGLHATLASLLFFPAAAMAGPLTVLHSWTMGEAENGVEGNAADSTLVDVVGELDLEPNGLPVYQKLGTAMGVFFGNTGSAHNVDAAEFFGSDSADVNPPDPARWGFEAVVRIDVLPDTNQEMAVFELGAGPTGLILQTFGNGAWTLHQSNVEIKAATVQVKVGQKQFLTAVFNNSRWELYVDGVLATSLATNAAGAQDPNAGIRIGAASTGLFPTRGFNGIIETARVFSYEDTFDIYSTLVGSLYPDSDDDGFSDAVETRYGTNPNNPASKPDTLSDIETAVEFKFPAARGRKYTIQSSTDLQEWITVEEDVVGIGEEITRVYSRKGEPARHYRAVMLEE